MHSIHQSQVGTQGLFHQEHMLTRVEHIDSIQFHVQHRATDVHDTTFTATILA